MHDETTNTPTEPVRFDFKDNLPRGICAACLQRMAGAGGAVAHWAPLGRGAKLISIYCWENSTGAYALHGIGTSDSWTMESPIEAGDWLVRLGRLREMLVEELGATPDSPATH